MDPIRRIEIANCIEGIAKVIGFLAAAYLSVSFLVEVLYGIRLWP